MKRPQAIQISIRKLCSQNWDDMPTSGDGRHCAHCSTTVVDFTTWTDAELYRFLAGRKEHTCGRYLASQLNRPIYIPQQPHSALYRIVVATGLTLIFAGVTAAQAQSRKSPYTTTQQQENLQANVFGGKGTIKGRLDSMFDMGKGQSYRIELLKQGNLKASCIANTDGSFVFTGIDTGNYRLRASSVQDFWNRGILDVQVAAGATTSAVIPVEIVMDGIMVDDLEERDSTGHVPSRKDAVKSN